VGIFWNFVIGATAMSQESLRNLLTLRIQMRSDQALL